MSDTKVLASMPPGMVHTLRLIARDSDVTVHGPMLKDLMVRGLVRHSGNKLAITWSGQKILNQVGEDE